MNYQFGINWYQFAMNGKILLQNSFLPDSSKLVSVQYRSNRSAFAITRPAPALLDKHFQHRPLQSAVIEI